MSNKEKGIERITYKNVLIEKTRFNAFLDNKSVGGFFSYCIMSPYYLKDKKTGEKLFLPLYCEDANGESINFHNLDQVKKYIDDFMVSKKGRIDDTGKEVHFVLNSEVREELRTRYEVSVNFGNPEDSDYYETKVIDTFATEKEALEYASRKNNLQCDYPNDYEEGDTISCLITDTKENKVIHSIDMSEDIIKSDVITDYSIIEEDCILESGFKNKSDALNIIKDLFNEYDEIQKLTLRSKNVEYVNGRKKEREQKDEIIDRNYFKARSKDKGGR